jgi:hypothetical protein
MRMFQALLGHVLCAPIVGLDDIVGAGGFGSMEVGALPQGGVVLRAEDLPRSFVGIPRTMRIAGSAIETIQCDVQREMRPDRCVLGPQNDILGHDELLVWDIRVGEVSLNASENPVPASVFVPGAWGTSIRATMTAVPSIGIQMDVQNAIPAGEGALDWDLVGGFFGPSAAPGAGAGGRSGVAGIVGDADVSEGNRDATQLPQSFVGIPTTAIPAADGTQSRLQCRITRDLRPDRLVLGFGTMSQCLVRDIRVSTISLNASMNPCVGEAFGPAAFGTRLRAVVTASPSVGILLVLEKFGAGNDPDAPNYRGAFFGPSRMATT